MTNETSRRMEAAGGYIALGLMPEAWAELEKIPSLERNMPEVLLVRIDWCVRTGNHESGFALAAAMCVAYPNHPQGYIFRSYCLHALKRTAEAKQLLVAAPEFMRSLPVYFYNLACYDSCLGHLPEARRGLQISFRMDHEQVENAASDPDLEPLWPELDELAAQSASLTLLTPEDLERLAETVRHGRDQQKNLALLKLIEARAESHLSHLLRLPDGAVANLAAHGLWQCWLGEAGVKAQRLAETGIAALEDGDLLEAESIFNAAVAAYPDWPEAKNKLATVLYLLGKYRESIALCREVTAVKPCHFGAWSGLAMCARKIADWPVACEAAREAFRLQPSNQSSRDLYDQIRAQADKNF